MGRIELKKFKNIFDEVKNIEELHKPSKLFLKGITRRWLTNNFGIILTVLLLFEIILAMFIHNFFYSGIYRSMDDRVNAMVSFLDKYNISQNKEFKDAAVSYIEGFQDKQLMELQIFDYKDNIIATSDGVFCTFDMSDFEISKSSNSGYGFWSGISKSGEKIVEVTKSVYNNDIYMGSVRCIVSLENANRASMLTIFVGAIIGILIIICIIISSLYFINSIVNPLREIGFTAKKIAQGDFNAKIEKKYDDEIGDLCDTINHMAGELGTSEKMKNDFLSSVSHELRTPLTAIKGWAETIKIDPNSDPDMTEKGMNVIIKESERLCGIVEELLDYSRIQNGRMILMMEKMDILAELTEAVYMFKDRATSENKYLLYSEPRLISPVLGDKNRLKQVFINIIDNALKYTDSGEAISIGIIENDGMVCISVSDNGCGISAVHLPKIKEKFYKANNTRRGSGIGLAIADEIVTLHNGELNIKSEENVGTTVEIKIPIADKENNEEEVKSE